MNVYIDTSLVIRNHTTLLVVIKPQGTDLVVLSNSTHGIILINRANRFNETIMLFACIEINKAEK